MHVHYPISLKCNRVNLLRFAYVRIILHTISHLIGTLHWKVQPGSAKWTLVGNPLTGHERPNGPNIPWNRHRNGLYMFTYIRTPSQDHLHREKLSVTFRDKIYTAWPKNGRPWLCQESCNRTPRPPDPFLIVHHASTLSIAPDHPSTHPASSVSLGQPVKGKNPMCDSNPTPNYPFIPNTVGDTRGLSRVLLIMHVTVIDNWSGLYFSPLWWLKATWLIWIHRIHTELQANRTRAGSAVSIS